MSQRIGLNVVLAMVLAAPGCRMCCPSYDYCGPTNPAESNSECCGMARRGSIFTNYVDNDVQYFENETVYENGTVIEEDATIDAENSTEPQVQPTPAPTQAAPTGPMTSHPRTSTPARFSSRRSS